MQTSQLFLNAAISLKSCKLVRACVVTALLLGSWSNIFAAPPFSGTIFLDPDILTASDPTAFKDIVSTGRGVRSMFDRRVNNFVTVNAYLFNASFDDGLQSEVQVNPEFGSTEAALVEARKYAIVIGRLPYALRKDVQTVWIHQGVQPFGGGNNNLLIHTGQADQYSQSGILEETLIHEASHTSLDAQHASSSGWLAAQKADPEFISTYARDNPAREDIAESFLTWLAVRYRSERISQSLSNAIVSTIPRRLEYFSQQALRMDPWVMPKPLGFKTLTVNAPSQTLQLTWYSLPGKVYSLGESADLVHWTSAVTAIPSQGYETTYPQSLTNSATKTKFFRVQEVPASGSSRAGS